MCLVVFVLIFDFGFPCIAVDLRWVDSLACSLVVCFRLIDCFNCRLVDWLSLLLLGWFAAL